MIRFTLQRRPCLYTATHKNCRITATEECRYCMDTKVKQMDTPLSQSSVSLKLEEIQKRCSELLDEPDALSDMTLEEPVADPRSNDPYNRQKS